MKEKPLFIPLTSRWFGEFKAGHKTKEYRKYGPRWNEKTCVVGREVVISKGYGKHERLRGKIVGVKVVPFVDLPSQEFYFWAMRLARRDPGLKFVAIEVEIFRD